MVEDTRERRPIDLMVCNCLERCEGMRNFWWFLSHEERRESEGNALYIDIKPWSLFLLRGERFSRASLCMCVGVLQQEWKLILPK